MQFMKTRRSLRWLDAAMKKFIGEITDR